MTTFWQASVRKKRRPRKIKKTHVPLAGCPQKLGTCTKVTTITPRKPCSALRPFARVKLSNKKIVTCHIPGIGHSLKKFSIVLVRGGRPNDLPAVRYRAIRNARRTDLKPVFGRTTSRSKYGIRSINRRFQIRRTRGIGTDIRRGSR